MFETTRMRASSSVPAEGDRGERLLYLIERASEQHGSLVEPCCTGWRGPQSYAAVGEASLR